MSRQHEPELASHRAARVVCAFAAAAVTWTLFSGVVSIAEEPPIAMAGKRNNEAVAKAASAAKLAQAQTAQTVVVAR